MSEAISKPSVRIEGADGLRGAAALLVVGHHMFDACGTPEWRLHRINVFRPVNEWWFSVDLFLVLSGFCLFLPYAGGKRKFDFLDFMRRRFWRIIPAYYASLVLVTLLYRVFDGALGLTDRTYPTGPLDIVLHVLLLHTLYIKTFWSWTGASWNLGLEWTWYWLFFIPVWLFRKNGPWIAVAIMSAVTVAWMICLRIFAGPMNSMSQVQWMVLHDTVPGRFMEFGLGMLVAWWLANRTINRRMVAVCYAAVVLGMLAGELRPPVDYGIRPLLYAVTFTFALLAAAAPGRNVIRSIFSFYPLRWVGQCSYSLYLFHLPFVLLLSNVYMRLTGSPVRSFFLDLISIPAIVLVAHCSYLVFEKPFMSVRPRPAVQSAAAAVATT